MNIIKCKKSQIIYFSVCIILAVVLGSIFSNTRWIGCKFRNDTDFVYGPYVPYGVQDDTSRFAVMDMQINLLDTILYVSDEQQYTIKVYLQEKNDDIYREVTPVKETQYENTIGYIFNDNLVAKNIYIDIKGKESEFATISLQSYTPEFTITPIGCMMVFVILFFLFVIYLQKDFFIGLYSNKAILKMLTKNDIKSRYAGSFFGIVWSFIQPLLNILVFGIVFQLGFKNPPVDNMPYILWFLPAYIPWLYFQDVVINATGCLREYSYLVKKLKFRVDMLPAIKVLSSLLIHFCFVIIMLVAYIAYGMRPTWMYLQLFYYSFAMVFMISGLAWLVAALAVFMKDLSQIISILLQLGYFTIPVFWTEEMLEPSILSILKLNPIYYIVQGYRDCMCYGKSFWDYPMYTIYFWCVSIIVFWIGITLFSKSKKHFPDMI